MDHNITKTGIWTGGPWEGFDVAALQKGNLQINPNLWNPQTNPASFLTSGTTVTNNKEEYSYTIYHNNNTTASARIANLGFNGRTGPWVFSAILWSTVNITVGADFCDKTAGNSIVITPQKQFVYFVGTNTNQYNTSGNYNGFFDIGFTPPSGGATLYIDHAKVEEGDTPTPWIPNVNDPIYTTYGLEDNGSLNNPIEANQFYEY